MTPPARIWASASRRGCSKAVRRRSTSASTIRPLNGLLIPQAAQKVVGAADLQAQQELMRRMLRAGGASMVYHFMSDDDLARILKHPMVSIASHLKKPSPK